MWILDVRLPQQNENDVFKVCDQVESVIGDYPVSSGSDFETRDVQYEFEDEYTATKASDDVFTALLNIYLNDEVFELSVYEDTGVTEK